jgi:hypothetical protein
MFRIGIGVLLTWSVVFGVGCGEKCKNPKWTEYRHWKTARIMEGPAMQCNIVITCPGHQGRPDSKEYLQGQVDPVITDLGSPTRDTCRQEAIVRGLVDKYCTVDASPALICLDATGTTGGPGPDYTGPAGGTLVTVGVGSGDYYFDGDGAGGTDDSGAEPGEEGQGGF